MRVTLYLHQEATAELCPAANCVYDVKKLVGGDAVVVVEAAPASPPR